MDTVLMVEKALKEAEEYPSRTELWKSLPKRIQYQTFKRVMDYLEAHGSIAFNGRHIVYTAVDNPKLEALMKSSIRSR